MDTTYSISDFCHIVTVDNNIKALYNSLSLGLVFVDHDMAAIFEKAVGGIIVASQAERIPEKLLTALLERRLIFPLGERNDLKDYLKIQKLLLSEGVSVLYLLTTDGCNLGCTYCYIENALPENYSFTMMSKETAVRGMELFAKNLSHDTKEPKVILYGGEPLLNSEVVYTAINHFEEMRCLGMLPKDTSLTINTNATLIDETFLGFVKGKDIQIAVSLDGTREMHNSMRKFKDGRGTYDKVIRNCEQMLKHGISFGFSITITKANIHNLEEVLLWVYEKFGVKSIGFNIAIHQNEKVIGMSEKEYGELVTQKLINCFKICREKGIYEDRIMRKVDAFVDGYPYIYDCGAPGDQFVISPEGLVGVCQAYCGNKKYFVPMDDVQDVRNHPIWKTWKSRSPLYQRQCYSCISIGICGGGCPYNAELKTGSIWGIDETLCIHSKGSVEFLIKDLYQQTLKNKSA